MKISIITATFNSADHIADCIRSVQNQKNVEIEHVIIDGMSEDRTMSIVNEEKNKSTVVVSEKDSGVYAALNKGINISSGEVIGFLHSDDTFCSETVLKTIHDSFQKSSIDGAYGNLVFVSKESGNDIRQWNTKKFKKQLIKLGWMMPHPTLFLKREVYFKIGNFDESFRIAGDYDFLLRLTKANPNLKFIPLTMTRMRLGGLSTKNLRHLLLKSKEDIIALKKNGFKYPLIITVLKILRKIPQFAIVIIRYFIRFN